MSLPRTAASAVLVSLSVLVPLPAGAQQPRKPPPSLFQQVIPNPTGNNGYEELVRAAELLKASKLFQRAASGGAALTLKRQVLGDRPVVEALRLLRLGLAKPVLSPREYVGPTTLLPEFAHFRSLARLLSIQQYVFLADGRITDAIMNVRLGLRLGRAIQTDTMISGLVGVAVNALSLTTLGSHLDQLSVRDCALLYQVCLEWLREPDPYLGALAAERQGMKNTLQELRAGIRAKGAGAVNELLSPEPDDPGTAALKDSISSDPEQAEAAFQQAEKQMDAFLGRVLEEARKPSWQRASLSYEDDGSLASRFVSMLMPAYEKVGDAYTRDQARIRLLACHAAILQYRWEHDRLPPSLDVLNLGELIIDPFTGQPVQYEVAGTRYRLASVGPRVEADDPKAVSGRRPVVVTPGD